MALQNRAQSKLKRAQDTIHKNRRVKKSKVDTVMSNKLLYLIFYVKL